MTNPPSSPVQPNLEPGPRRGGRLGAVVVLVLVALAGVIAGIALDRLRVIPHMFGGPGHGGHEWGPGGGPPRDHGFRDRFAHELGLSPEQQVRIDSIMDQQGRELRAVRGRVQPQLDSIITRTRRQLDSVLTPEQRQKAEAIRRRHPRPPGRPPEDFRPGSP
jgi:Spy/CpxP family protein refolding chaperone